MMDKVILGSVAAALLTVLAVSAVVAMACESHDKEGVVSVVRVYEDKGIMSSQWITVVMLPDGGRQILVENRYREGEMVKAHWIETDCKFTGHSVGGVVLE